MQKYKKIQGRVVLPPQIQPHWGGHRSPRPVPSWPAAAGLTLFYSDN